MSFFINPFQLLKRGMGVVLRRTDAFVTQQVLNTLKTCTVVEHGRCKGMTQHVGGTLLQGCHRRQVLMHNLIHLTTRHPVSLVIQEQGPATFSELRIAHCLIMPQPYCQLLTDGNDALLVSLTRHLELHSGEIDILVIQPRQLRAPESRFI